MRADFLLLIPTQDLSELFAQLGLSVFDFLLLYLYLLLSTAADSLRPSSLARFDLPLVNLLSHQVPVKHATQLAERRSTAPVNKRASVIEPCQLNLNLRRAVLRSQCENLQDQPKPVKNPYRSLWRQISEGLLIERRHVSFCFGVKLSGRKLGIFVDGLEHVAADPVLSSLDYVVPPLLQFLLLHGRQRRIDKNNVDLFVVSDEVANFVQFTLLKVSRS